MTHSVKGRSWHDSFSKSGSFQRMLLILKLNLKIVLHDFIMKWPIRRNGQFGEMAHWIKLLDPELEYWTNLTLGEMKN